MSEATLDPRVVAEGLANLGVASGDQLGMHSRMPALGRVMIRLSKQGGDAMRRGVHGVIDGVVQAVGPRGLVMVPTFSFSYAGPSGRPPWNPAKSPSQVGWLTDEFWRRDEAVRSNNPTHSCACIGPDAEAACADHEHRTPLGLDTPFHRLAVAGGWICYLGTNGETLSLLHVAEVVSGVPYAKVFNWDHVGWECAASVEQPDGSAKRVPIEEPPGCSRNFGRFDVEAEGEGLLRTGRIYGAKVALFRAKDAMDLAVDRIHKEPGFFLCRRGTCPACDVRWDSM